MSRIESSVECLFIGVKCFRRKGKEGRKELTGQPPAHDILASPASLTTIAAHTGAVTFFETAQNLFFLLIVEADEVQ